MNVKIQGGGSGHYANKGSSSSIVNYLAHEDVARLQEGKHIEAFFNNDCNRVSSKEVVYQIDQNKAQLGRNDSKFFVLTVSPSENELQVMGKSQSERAVALRDYVRNEIMKSYAENFNKNLDKSKIRYYAKIHYKRGDKAGLNMHCHIIVSRKDVENKIKLSPQTNHRNTEKGMVKGGFDRRTFFQACEAAFDKRFSYQRAPEESFDYCNSLKNGSFKDIKDQIEKSVRTQMNQDKSKGQNKSKEIEEGVKL